MEAVIKNVRKNSLAYKAGIRACDILLEINLEKITNILVYKFLISDEELNLKVKKPNGTIKNFTIINENFEDLGIEFLNPLISKPKSCSNRCIFCFIDQLPKGMRKSLYFKDDDSILSFLHGNYVTLTNLKSEDINNIIKYKISPINISVHSTDKNTRIKMLGNKNAGNILEIMKRFKDAKIFMNCQIVACKNINDDIEKTVFDLLELYPYVKSVSVVPVGLTKFRNNLYPLKEFSFSDSVAMIDKVETLQEICRVNTAKQKHYKNSQGINFIYASDEFYIRARRKLPKYKEYDGFPQLENGVGMIALFRKEIYEQKTRLSTPCSLKKQASMAVGTAFFSFMKNILNKLGLNIFLYPILNNFFGESVTVSGLITGQDLISQLKYRTLGEVLFISENMLNDNLFLDSISLEEAEKALAIKIVPLSPKGSKFLDSIYKEVIL